MDVNPPIGNALALELVTLELVSLEPGNPDFRNNLGILLVRTGAIAAALKEFEAALKTNPAHAAARRNLELARQRLGQE